jgi:hypothetical protein
MMEELIVPGTSIKLEDIVWAKIAGYPWWPGRVVAFKTDQSKIQVAVNFIGDHSHAYLGISKVVDYRTNREKHSKTKRRDLQKAINEADQIIEHLPSKETLKTTKNSTRKRKSANIKVTKSSSSKRLRTIEDVSKWLEEFVNSEKLKVDTSSTKKLLTALEIITQKITNPEAILETKVGVNLNKLTEFYEEDMEYGEIVKKIEETLETLKDIVLSRYFGFSLSFHKDTLNKSTINSGNQQESEEIKFYSSIIKEELLPIREHSLENLDKGEELQMVEECVPVDLRNNVCEAIAKLIEEVK